MRRKVELYERIRRDQAQHGWGIRRLAREHRCHRRDVRQALASAVPPPRKRGTRPWPVLGPWVQLIDDILIADRKAPRKQRHSAHPLWERLRQEVPVPSVDDWAQLIDVCSFASHEEEERHLDGNPR